MCDAAESARKREASVWCLNRPHVSAVQNVPRRMQYTCTPACAKRGKRLPSLFRNIFQSAALGNQTACHLTSEIPPAPYAAAVFVVHFGWGVFSVLLTHLFRKYANVRQVLDREDCLAL